MRRAQVDDASQIVRNLALNPSLTTTGAAQTIRTNLALNPSFEGAGSVSTVRTNVCVNPSMETAGSGLTLRTNLLVNPSMEGTSPTVTTRTNLAPNPNALTGTGWFAANGMTASTAFNQAGGPVYTGTFFRMTSTGTATGMGYFGVAYGQPGAGNAATVTAGTVYTLSAFVRVTMTGFSVQPVIRMRWKDSSGTTLSDITSFATGATSGNWVRISATGTAPASAAYVEALGGYGSIDLSTVPIGSTVDMAGVLIEATNTMGNYFDGTVPAFDNLVKTPATAMTNTTITTGISYAGSTWNRSTVSAGTGTAITRQNVNLSELTQGMTYTVSVTLANDTAFSQQMQLDWCDTGYSSVTLSPGEIRRVVITSSRASYDSTYRFSDLEINRSATESRSLLYKDWVIEAGPSAGDFYTGTGDYTYIWNGTANASTSSQRATGVGNWALSSLASVHQTSIQKYSAGKSLAVITKGGNGDGTYASDIYGITAGTSYTFSAWVKTTTSVPISIDFRFKDGANGTISDPITAFTPTVGVWTRISATAVAPANSAALQPMLRIYAAHTATVFYVDDVLIESSAVLGTYFDGASAATSDFTHGWAGTVNASMSEQRAVSVSGRTGLAPYSATWQSAIRSRSGAKSAAIFTKLSTPINTSLWYPSSDYVIGSGLAANTTYTWSAYVWVPSGGGTVLLMEAGGTTGAANTTFDRWERISVTVTTPASGMIYLRLRSATTIPAGTTIWVDDELLESTPLALEYFDGTNPIQNLATDPKPTTLTIPENGAGWNGSRWFGTGGTGSYVLVSNATDGPTYTLNGYIRKTWTVGANPGDTGFNHVVGNGLPINPGTTYTISSYMRTSASGKTNANITVQWRDSAGTQIGSIITGSQSSLPQGVWTRLSSTFTSPANAVYAVIYSDQDGGTAWVPGDTLDGTGLLIEKTSTLNAYYGGTGDFTYSWNGTVNNSSSLQRGTSVFSVSGTAAVIQSSDWATADGKKSLRVIPNGNSTDTFADIGAYLPAGSSGKTFTVSATMRLAQPQAVSTRRRIEFFSTSGSYVNTWATTGPNVAGSERQALTFTIPAGQNWFLRLYAGGAAGNGDVWWDDLLVEEHPTQLPYFDGTTPSSGDFSYMWAGAANSSTSSQRVTTIANTQANKSVGTFWNYQSTAEDGKKVAKWVAPAGTINSSWRVAGFTAGSIGWEPTTVKAGGVYTLFMRYRTSGWGSGQTFQISIQDATAANPVMSVGSSLPLNAIGWQEYRRTFTALRDATYSSTIYASLPPTPQATTDGVFEVREWLLVAGEYTGAYIDGSKPFSKWEGTANGSASISYPPQLYDIAGKPDVDITAAGSYNLPNTWGTSEGKTVYTVVEEIGGKIPNGSPVYPIVAYGSADISDTVPNQFVTLRFQYSTWLGNGLLARRAGGGGPIEGNSASNSVLVSNYGMRETNQFLFLSVNGSGDLNDNTAMSMPNERITITNNTYHRHIRTLIYRGEHSASTRLAVSRYLAAKYGANVI